jgi:hypothetical protein
MAQKKRNSRIEGYLLTHAQETNSGAIAGYFISCQMTGHGTLLPVTTASL